MFREQVFSQDVVLIPLLRLAIPLPLRLLLPVYREDHQRPLLELALQGSPMPLARGSLNLRTL